MDQKKLLIENEDIKQIVEKNQQIIDAMKKLSQVIDCEDNLRFNGEKESDVKEIDKTKIKSNASAS